MLDDCLYGANTLKRRSVVKDLKQVSSLSVCVCVYVLVCVCVYVWGLDKTGNAKSIQTKQKKTQTSSKKAREKGRQEGSTKNKSDSTLSLIEENKHKRKFSKEGKKNWHEYISDTRTYSLKGKKSNK